MIGKFFENWLVICQIKPNLIMPLNWHLSTSEYTLFYEPRKKYNHFRQEKNRKKMPGAWLNYLFVAHFVYFVAFFDGRSWIIGMTSLGPQRSTSHFMEELSTTITIILLEAKAKATLPQSSPIVTTFMEPIRWLINLSFSLLYFCQFLYETSTNFTYCLFVSYG